MRAHTVDKGKIHQDLPEFAIGSIIDHLFLLLDNGKFTKIRKKVGKKILFDLKIDPSTAWS
jgi:hypothetical protein